MNVAALGQLGDEGADRAGVGAARVQPALHPRRDRVDAVGLDGDLAAGGHDAVFPGELPRLHDGGGVVQHRVVTVLKAGGARMVGLAGELHPPPAVRPDAGADGHGPAEVDQPAALLDVQLDEAPDAAQRLLVPPDVRGVVPGRRHCLGHGRPVTVTQPQCVIPRKRAGHHPRPGAGDAEPRAFLVTEVHDADRP